MLSSKTFFFLFENLTSPTEGLHEEFRIKIMQEGFTTKNNKTTKYADVSTHRFCTIQILLPPKITIV